LTQWAAWTHSAKVTLNTTASGANISQIIVDFPVLVRLNSVNFNFSQARTNGEDMRFIKQDNSALAFEIEYWDSASAIAIIWVKIDTVYGNNSSQYFAMLWGNPSAKTKSNPAAVFDTSKGFQGVWHLGESGGTTQKDATYNKYIGTPEAMTGSSDVMGIIARAQDFDGSSQCISVLNARNSRLDVQTDSFYTVSSWVFARTLNNGLHVFLSKGSAQYGLMINKANRWEFYGGLVGYGVDTTTTAPATANAWTLVTGVRNGMKQYLYINGVLADSTLLAAGTSPGISNNFYDLVIGRQSDDQSQWFDGIIDESRVEGIARSAGWNKLCYQNQRSDQVLVQVVPIK
jgi:biopolymer transport protein ExbB